MNGGDRGSRLRAVLPLIASGASLCGCPQLLDDDFRPSAVGLRGGDGGLSSSGDAGALDGPADVARLSAALTHRYSFDGFGTNPPDARGGNPAYIYNGVLLGLGFVRLTGDDYVSLPNGVLSSSSDKTLEAWLTWRGGEPWQRIFDFGVSSAGEFEQSVGVSYLFLAASSNAGGMVLAYSQSGYDDEVRLVGSARLPRDVETHVAVVVDSARDRVALYIDGALDAEGSLTGRLGSIEDVNAWIGRSQYATDPGLDADVTEFRIYDHALRAADLDLSFRLGPDAAL